MKNVRSIITGACVAMIMAATPAFATVGIDNGKSPQPAMVRNISMEENNQLTMSNGQLDDSALSNLHAGTVQHQKKELAAKKSQQDQPGTIIYISSGAVVVLLIILLIILL